MRKMFIRMTIMCFGLLQGCSPFFKVVSAHFAKEFCSCYFVVGQSRQYCENYAEEYIPTSGYEVIEEAREIVAFGLGFQSRAKFISKKYGCRLTD